MREMYGQDEGSFLGSKAFKVIVAVAVVALAAVFLNPFSCVSASDRGVRLRFGQVIGSELGAGLQVHIPFAETIRTYSIQPKEATIRVPVGQEGAITKDNQTVGVVMKIYWKNAPGRIQEIAKGYSEDRLENLVKSNSESYIKAVVGTNTIFELAENQIKAMQTTRELLVEGLKAYPIEIVDLKLVNYDWSDQFDAQIAETMNRAQQVKQKEQELQSTAIEAQKKVKESEAIATATINSANAAKQKAVLEAEADKEQARLRAEGKVLEGEGIRKYNEAIARNLEIELQIRKLEIEKIKAEKWDGKYVPNNMYGPIPVDTVGGIKH